MSADMHAYRLQRSNSILSMSADMRVFILHLICREHASLMLLVTGACGHLPGKDKRSLRFDKSPYHISGRNITLPLATLNSVLTYLLRQVVKK